MPVGLFGKATSIERKVKKLLNKLSKELHFAYRVNHSIKGGYNVDYFLPQYNLVIELQGGYYHADPRIYESKKLNEMQLHNVSRDKRKRIFLDKLYNYVIWWEKEINEKKFGKEFDKVMRCAINEILSGNKYQKEFI